MAYKEEEILIGRNAVFEAIKANIDLDTLYYSETAKGIGEILRLAKNSGVVAKKVNSKKIESFGKNTQGVVAIKSVAAYSELDDILKVAEKKGESPFLILCDGIEDPQNLGAIIRTAEACGAHGIVIPKRRSASLTSTVSKTSAGAACVLPVARVSNLSSCIDKLKKCGLWIYCADMDGTNWCEDDLKGPIALVIGSEGQGVSRLVKEKCDKTISLPMCGQINSLNASVAGGIIMYEITRQRRGISALN